jgi:hypothetical protein
MLDKSVAFLRAEWMLVLLVGATVLLRVPSMFEPLWYGDEAVYLTVARQVARGDLLYVDIFDHKPPLLYYLTAGSIAVFGPSVAAIKILAMAAAAGTLISVYVLGRRLMNKAAALIAVAVLSFLITPTWLEGNVAGSEILMILPTCIGMLLGLRRQFFLAGCCFSLAFLLKGPAVFDFAAFFVFVALAVEKGSERQTVDDLARLTAGFLAPFVVSMLFFAVQGALGDYIYAAFLSGVDYTSEGETGVSNDYLFSHDRLIVNGLPILLLVGLFAARSWRRWRAGEPSSVGAFDLLLLWLVFAFYGALFGGRPYEHYLIQAAPPFALMCGYVLTHLGARSLIGAGALMIILGTTAVEDFEVGYRKNLWDYRDYNENFVDYAFGDKPFEQYADFFDGRTARNYRVATLLDSDSVAEDAKVYVFASQPALYYRSGLEPMSRFIVSHHLTWHDSWVRETADELTANPPRYIIVEEPRKAEEPKRVDLPELERAIREDYELIDSDGILRVYKRTE